jgi:hypothetical protein
MRILCVGIKDRYVCFYCSRLFRLVVPLSDERRVFSARSYYPVVRGVPRWGQVVRRRWKKSLNLRTTLWRESSIFGEVVLSVVRCVPRRGSVPSLVEVNKKWSRVVEHYTQGRVVLLSRWTRTVYLVYIYRCKYLSVCNVLFYVKHCSYKKVSCVVYDYRLSVCNIQV